jgi:hypothetical protein
MNHRIAHFVVCRHGTKLLQSATMLLFPSHFGWRRLLASFAVIMNITHGLNCTLCKDGSVPDDLDSDLTFINEGQNVTCRSLWEAAPSRTTDDSCAIMQAEGAALCSCPVPDPTNCTLCQDGSPVPDPSLEYVQGFPCGVLEVFIRADDRVGACEAYQVTAGFYCRCSVDESNVDTNICGLCGDKALPNPGLLVPAEPDDTHTDGSVRPCSAIEFDATFFFSECPNYQELYGSACCGGEGDTTTSSGYSTSIGKLLLVIVVAASAALGFHDI